jgi:hypothetical protein
MVNAGVDSKEVVIAGFIDKSDAKSYVITVGADEEVGPQADEEVYQWTKQETLRAHKANESIDEADVQFHGELYHRLRFKVQTDKWGLCCFHFYRRRAAGKVIAVQLGFPYDQQLVQREEIPQELGELDSNVHFIDEKPRN